MNSEDDFITHLLGFGLTEKEAHCYFYLLKYGPKTPSSLAKPLHTYREDIHRTLQSLADKGMVRPSLDSPTLYTAVELEVALDSALKQHESELREMETRKLELEKLAQQQRFRPSDEVSTFKILKSIKDLVAASITDVMSIDEELLYVVPDHMLVIASAFGINEEVKRLVDNGGIARGISNITYSCIDAAQEILDIGEDLRHYDHYTGVYFSVLDKKFCFHSIHNAAQIKLTESIAVLSTDDPVYARYLVSTFELLWKRSVPAEERIRELLKRGPPKADQLQI